MGALTRLSAIAAELMRKLFPNGRLETAQEKRELEKALKRAGFSNKQAKMAVGDLFRRQAG